MLRKLMKHEFRATVRTMGPLYLVLLVTAAGANLSTRGLMNTEFQILGVLGGLLVTAFAAAIVAVCVMSMVVMVRRFYKNLLQDEGYIMMTLPVSVHQQVWSKLFVSAVWFAATLLMVCLAGLIVAYEIGFMQDLARGIGEVFRAIAQELNAYYAINGTALLVEFLAVCFVGCCAMCLQFYAALAVGHSRSNHKLAWSVLAFFVMQFAMQFLSGAGVLLLDESGLHHWLLGWGDHLSGMAAGHLAMGTLLLTEVIYGTVFYFLTTYFLKKRLNLE